jgi:hypothetical protein
LRAEIKDEDGLVNHGFSGLGPRDTVL